MAEPSPTSKPPATTPSLLHLRNAVTGLMRQAWATAHGYQYAHNYEGGVAPDQTYLPDRLRGAKYYKPGTLGREAALAKALEERAEANKQPVRRPESETISQSRSDRSDQVRHSGRVAEFPLQTVIPSRLAGWPQQHTRRSTSDLRSKRVWPGTNREAGWTSNTPERSTLGRS